MSCNKLLQSHLLRHFHYLNKISLVIWLLYVLYLVVCFQSIFDGLQSIATDDEKHYQCQNIVLNKKKNWTIIFGIQSVNSITVCTNGRSRHSWECWQRHESIWHGTIRLLFRECSPLRTRSSFKRFLYCGSKVLGVVQSTKCVVLKWETACRFSTCVVRSFFYLDIDFVDILFRVPQCYLFRRRTLFAYFKSLIKISKSFKKWNCRNCLSKTGLNTSFSFY